jgi:hypothetical protein
MTVHKRFSFTMIIIVVYSNSSGKGRGEVVEGKATPKDVTALSSSYIFDLKI